MRGSLNRARKISVESNTTFEEDYFFEVIRAFDELLDHYGASGIRFEQRCNRIAEMLQSDSHSVFQEGLESLGKLLGYTAYRPEFSGAPDCVWRGKFGSFGEMVTFEAKIEDSPSNEIILSDLGQAHNQRNTADSCYGTRGYVVSGAIVTHLTPLGDGVEGAMGGIRIIPKQVIYDLWVRIRSVITSYRDKWLPNHFEENVQAAQSIRSRIPETGWLTRVLEQAPVFVTTEWLMQEWRS